MFYRRDSLTRITPIMFHYLCDPSLSKLPPLVLENINKRFI
jgi:hypothetical protein